MTPSPIESYALLGDTRTACLSGPDGSIDWMCLPRFDGRPVFARLIGGADAGHFRIAPQLPPTRTERAYRPRTAAIETRWRVNGSEVVLTEGMVADVAGTALPATLLVRHVEVHGQPVPVAVTFEPRFGWDRRTGRVRRVGDATVVSDGPDVIAVRSSTGAPIPAGRTVVVDVAPGAPLTVIFAAAHREPIRIPTVSSARRALARDEHGWRRWIEACRLPSSQPEAVGRSLITLRLLTYSPSGAPVAAATTSLPEHLGGERNWDYRYAWPRDASLGVAAFLATGRIDEADRFLTWLVHATRLDRPRLPVLLTVHGTPAPAEKTVNGWPGYAASTPVRVGNAAAGQHQLDGYGWPLDAAHRQTRTAGPLRLATLRALAAFADRAAATWDQPDAGIWEVRDAPRHHVHSKVMAWVALDRALALTTGRRRWRVRRARWHDARDRLAVAIRSDGYDHRRGSYVRAFGANDLDAALLLLPDTGFEPPSSPRTAGTVRAIAEELACGGPFLHRYTPGSDGLAGGEGAFLPCSFWLAGALARTGQTDRGEGLLDDLVDLGGPLGLYAEEADPATGAHLGNYPQALTHAALVNAAVAIDHARHHP